MLRAFHLQLGKLLLCDSQLLGDGCIVIQVAVGIDQVEPQLRGIKHAFSRAFRHGSQGCQILPNCVTITTLNLGQVAADGMEAVVIGVKLFSAREVSACLIQIADAQLRLCGGQLHVD